MINHIFDLCVVFLQWLAHVLGVTYQAINVWVFCVIWPILTLLLIGIVIVQHRKIATLIAHAPNTK